MSNTTISPNMMMPVPVVGIDPGPDWANNINASLNIIDGHMHSPGFGVLINPEGIDINTDLPFNSNNAALLRSARFAPQPSLLALPTDIGCLYESGVDLYYNDGNGNQVRITQSGSVTGATGTITGLPSGTAGVSYSAGTFTFDSATNTPANMVVGPLVIGQNVANPKTITIQPTTGIPANYNLNLPAAAPIANQIMVSDASGNLTWLSGYIQQGSFTATLVEILGTSTVTWYYSMVGNVVTISQGSGTYPFTKNVTTGGIHITGLPGSILPSVPVACSPFNLAYNDGGSPTSYPQAFVTATSAGLTLTRDNAGNPFGAGTQNTMSFTTFSYIKI